MYTGTLLSRLVIPRVSANSIFDLNLSGANPSYNRWKMTRDIPGLVTWPWATTYLPLLNYLFYHWGFKIIVFLSLFLLFSDVGTTLSLFCAYSKMRNVSFLKCQKITYFVEKWPILTRKCRILTRKYRIWTRKWPSFIEKPEWTENRLNLRFSKFSTLT